MLVYSVASTQSFEMIEVIRNKILNHLVCCPEIPPPLAVPHDLLTIPTGHRMGPYRRRRQQERSETRAAPGYGRGRQEARRGLPVLVHGGQCPLRRERRQGVRAHDRADREGDEPERAHRRGEVVRGHVREGRGKGGREWGKAMLDGRLIIMLVLVSREGFS